MCSPIQRSSHQGIVQKRKSMWSEHNYNNLPLELSSRVVAALARLGAARRVFETDGLEAAAKFLGNQSLDATARALRYDWWAQN